MAFTDIVTVTRSDGTTNVPFNHIQENVEKGVATRVRRNPSRELSQPEELILSNQATKKGRHRVVVRCDRSDIETLGLKEYSAYLVMDFPSDGTKNTVKEVVNIVVKTLALSGAQDSLLNFEK
jgi:hypothetical protein